MSDDALVELEKLLPELAPAVERRKIGANLGRTVDTLKDAPRQIERLKALVEIAQETDFENDPEHREAIHEIADDTHQTALSMLRAQTAEDLRIVKENYEGFVKRLGQTERLVRSHWRTLLDRDFGPLITIGVLLEKIEGTAAFGHRLVECGEDARRSANEPTAEALRDAIDRVRRTKERLDRERASLTEDAEVDRFLDALAEQRATLRMVTPRVRNWLDQHADLDNFVVRGRF